MEKQIHVPNHQADIYDYNNVMLCNDPWCWNIYLQDWVIYEVNGGKYSIHGSSGYDYNVM